MMPATCSGPSNRDEFTFACRIFSRYEDIGAEFLVAVARMGQSYVELEAVGT
jgi:hypothetical protein